MVAPQLDSGGGGRHLDGNGLPVEGRGVGGSWRSRLLAIALMGLGGAIGPYATARQLNSGLSPPVSWWPWPMVLSWIPWYSMMGMGWVAWLVGVGMSLHFD